MQKAGPLVMPTGRKSEGLQSAKTTADVREISRSSHWTLLGTIRVTVGYITVPAGTMYIPTAQIFPCLRRTKGFGGIVSRWDSDQTTVADNESKGFLADQTIQRPNS